MNRKKIIKYTCLFIVTFVIFSNKVLAAPISISASRNSVSIGQTVVITVKTTDAMGSYSISSSNNNVLSGGTSGGFSTPNEQVTTSFVAKTEGTATITFKPINMALFSTEQQYSTPSSVTITVGNKTTTNTQKKELSSDNTLSSLSIDGIELTPTFNKNTTEYSVSLEADVSKINVKATASDKTAKITGIGEIEVTEGDNNIEVVVTAENGSTKTYRIKANVKEYDPINIKINKKNYTVVRNIKNINVPQGYEETKIKIEGEEVPAFKNKITGYTLVALKDDKGNQNFYVYKKGKYTLYKEYTFNKVILYPMELDKIPEGYKKTTIIFNDDKIVAYKLNKNSNYALIYGMNIETGKKHIYMYDKEEDTLQIYNDEITKKLNKKIEEYKIIIATLSGISTLLLLILIITIAKNHKYNKEKKQIRKALKKQKKMKKKEKKIIDEDDIDIKQIM